MQGPDPAAGPAVDIATDFAADTVVGLAVDLVGRGSQEPEQLREAGDA